MDLKLTNKRVLVLGSSKGIGFSIADSFINEGAKVMLVARNEKQLIKSVNILKKNYPDSNIDYYVCDCSKNRPFIGLKKYLLSKFKVLDILICNIGDGRSSNDIIPNESVWEKTWNNNFKTALIPVKHLLEDLQMSKGNLTFISSIAGMEIIGAPTDYSVAKSSVISLAKNLAIKMGNSIRVNVICPGNIIFKNSEWEKKINQSPKKIKKIISDKVPMKRFGKPEEIANAVLFLSSEKASFITGSVLVIDGGQTVKI